MAKKKELQKKAQKKVPSLKGKEAEFVAAYIENNENGTEAVKAVYGIEDENYAAVKANRLIRKANISQAIVVTKTSLRDALIDKGITPKKIAEKVGELLENSSYKAIDAGLRHATALYGVELDKVPPSQKVYNFFFNPDIQQDVKQIEERIKAKLIQPDVQPTESAEKALGSE